MSKIMLVFTAACCAFVQAAPSRQQQFERLAQQRFKAFFDGDKATYQRLVAPDAIFSYSNGRTLNYAQAMKELAPLATPGSYNFHYEDVQFRDFGESVLMVYTLVFHGPSGDYRGVESDCFARRHNVWQLVSVHGTTIPYPNRVSITADAAALDEYAGEYANSSGDYYTISHDGNQLMGQRNGYPKVPWLAESADVFYVSSDPTATRIFMRDSHGKIAQLVSVDVEGDTVWRRKP